MTNNQVTFTDVAELAKFLAELERQGIVYYVNTGDSQYTVALKGC